MWNKWLFDRGKFVFSPDVILCGWLGSKHQLTNYVLFKLKTVKFRHCNASINCWFFFFSRADHTSCKIYDKMATVYWPIVSQTVNRSSTGYEKQNHKFVTRVLNSQYWPLLAAVWLSCRSELTARSTSNKQCMTKHRRVKPIHDSGASCRFIISQQKRKKSHGCLYQSKNFFQTSLTRRRTGRFDTASQ